MNSQIPRLDADALGGYGSDTHSGIRARGYPLLLLPSRHHLAVVDPRLSPSVVARRLRRVRQACRRGEASH
jgi:hypothetical protein